MKKEGLFSEMKKRIAIVAIFFVAAASYINIHRDTAVAMNRPFSNFPTSVGVWRMSGESFMTERVLDKLRPTDYISRNYIDSGGSRVGLYIGYHGGGKNVGEIHSPKHCLPGSGWYEAQAEKREMLVGQDKINLVSSVYQKGEGKELFLYWFQVKNKTLDNEYALKLAEVFNSMLYKRRDAAFIRISVPYNTDYKKANQKGDEFIREFYPVIKTFLPS